jgi:hypothetical protein
MDTRSISKIEPCGRPRAGQEGLGARSPAASKKAAREAPKAALLDDAIIDVALTRFLARYEKGRRRASTIRQGSRLLLKELLPALKGRAVADIKRRDVRDMIDKVETRAPVTANRLLAVRRRRPGAHLGSRRQLFALGGNDRRAWRACTL